MYLGRLLVWIPRKMMIIVIVSARHRVVKTDVRAINLYLWLQLELSVAQNAT